MCNAFAFGMEVTLGIDTEYVFVIRNEMQVIGG